MGVSPFNEKRVWSVRIGVSLMKFSVELNKSLGEAFVADGNDTCWFTEKRAECIFADTYTDYRNVVFIGVETDFLFGFCREVRSGNYAVDRTIFHSFAGRVKA